MNKILVEVSVGELLDKISILEIKKEKIKDPEKLKFINDEYIILKDQLEQNVKSDSKNNSVAYIQVKDLSKNENEKVFIFNGWTFASDPTVAPFDHAIYDLQLVNCNKV